MNKVSILMITYNHEKYIAQAIESIISQKTNFDFELVIGEDSSPDKTLAVCEQYAAAYPHIIRLLPSDKNYGMIENELRTLRACTGEYIAMCEGDDYWIDEYKLQKQADFLDENEDFSMCFSAVEVKNAPGEKDKGLFRPLEKEIFTIDDIITPNYFIPTPTLFFRRKLLDPAPSFLKDALCGDVGMHLILTDKGKAKYFPEKTAVYRNHGGGFSKTEEFKLKAHRSQFDMFDNFNEYTHFKYHDKIKKLVFPAAKTLLIYESQLLKGMERRKHVLRMIKGYNRYSDTINLKEITYYTILLFFPFLIKIYKIIFHK